MARTIASLSPASGLAGNNGSILNSSHVEGWMQYFVTALEIPLEALNQAKGSEESMMEVVKFDFNEALQVLEKHLLLKTFMVGHSISVADISGCCALYQAETYKLWEPESEKLVNVNRWYQTVKNQDFFQESISLLSSPFSAQPKAANSGDEGVVTLSGVAPGVVPKLYNRQRVRVKELLASASFIGSTVTVAGWARTTRNANKGKLLFLELTDGSCGTSLQCVLEDGPTEGFAECKGAGGTGASFWIEVEVIESPAQGQAVEIKVTKATVLGAVYGGDASGTKVGGMLYPLSKKGHTLEFMRENAHLRPRSRLHAAAMRIRHAMAFATHKFFNDNGFLYIHTPIVTCADCEGAGEQFAVTTMMGTDPHKTDVALPVHPPVDEKKLSKKEMKRLAKKKTVESTKPEEVKIPGAVDYTKDFFAKRANLTVSGQLNVETHACALSDVYTFGPTFRAENSHTSRHLAEFWMIEPEIAFADLEKDIDLAEDYLKYCVKYALEMCAEDLEFLENSEHGEKGLRDRLRNVIDNPFKRLPYTEGIEILKKAVEDGVKFEEKVEWGIDLPTEMERYLCETAFKQPVVLTHYPKDIKAFYMKLNDDEKTVAAADILVPKIGELIGGSQREHRLDVLTRRCTEMGLDPKAVWWYLDLRKYGTVPHAGFGLGFERLILFVTGLDNIRDVIPFPRWPGNAEF